MLLEERRCFTLFFFCNFAESTPYNLLRLSMGYKVGKRERVMEEKVLFVRSDGFVIEKSEKMRWKNNFQLVLSSAYSPISPVVLAKHFVWAEKMQSVFSALHPSAPEASDEVRDCWSPRAPRSRCRETVATSVAADSTGVMQGPALCVFHALSLSPLIESPTRRRITLRH